MLIAPARVLRANPAAAAVQPDPSLPSAEECARRKAKKMSEREEARETGGTGAAKRPKVFEFGAFFGGICRVGPQNTRWGDKHGEL